VSVCRSCQAPIVWAVTDAGRAMPVDAEPVEDGNLILEYPTLAGAPRLVRTVEAGTGTHVSHFATCPDAAQHRRQETA
jgi:hypothetical protein